jgi:hypothetical protein
MQLVEVSSFGMRAAVVTLRRSQTPLRFVLFPMVHLGTPDYYRQVAARLRDCQLVVAEGIRGRSAAAAALTMAYRLLGQRRRLGLVVQDLGLQDLEVPVVGPDMSGVEFDTRWRGLPLRLRLQVLYLVPVYATGMLLFGSRRFLARALGSLDDLPGPGQAVPERFEALDRLVVDDRDRLLVRALDSIHQQRRHQEVEVAVVYGAGHMPAVVQHLSARLGYRAASAEWFTVFEF